MYNDVLFEVSVLKVLISLICGRIIQLFMFFFEILLLLCFVIEI